MPGVTVDRQCGSSQQAVHFAAQAVLSGTADLVVAGGVQNMSQIPIAAAMMAGQPYGFDDPFCGSAGWRARYGDQEMSQFRSADMIAASGGSAARRWRSSRWPATSGRSRAIDAGDFAAEIAPSAARPPTSARAGTPRWSGWPALPPLRAGRP